MARCSALPVDVLKYKDKIGKRSLESSFSKYVKKYKGDPRKFAETMASFLEWNLEHLNKTKCRLLRQFQFTLKSIDRTFVKELSHQTRVLMKDVVRISRGGGGQIVFDQNSIAPIQTADALQVAAVVDSTIASDEVIESTFAAELRKIRKEGSVYDIERSHAREVSEWALNMATYFLEQHAYLQAN